MIANVNIKVCGMTQPDNIEQIESLGPGYLGFIFYENSPRNVLLPSLLTKKTTKRVGVFVNASLAFIQEKITAFDLDVIQLHGDESVSFCKTCKEQLGNIEVWKVFGIQEQFAFNPLKEYEPYIDAFLFDTKTANRGGSGKTFNWNVLENYKLTTPIVISGGIGLEQIEALQTLLKSNLPIQVIDLNSRFELTPGIKDFKKLKTFLDAI